MRRFVPLVLLVVGCPAPEAKTTVPEGHKPEPAINVAKTPKVEGPFARVRTSTDTAIDRGNEQDPGWTVPRKIECPNGGTLQTKQSDGLLFGWCVVGDRREGPILAHRESKQVAISGTYNRGGRAGVWRFFDEDGEEIQRDVYRDPFMHRLCWSKGKLRFQGKTSYTTAGALLASRLPSLPVSFYYEDGLRRADVHFLVNTRHGPAKFFYEKNARSESIGAFLNDEPVGRWRSFDRNGREIAPQPVREHMRLKIPGHELYDPVLDIEAPSGLLR